MNLKNTFHSFILLFFPFWLYSQTPSMHLNVKAGVSEGIEYAEKRKAIEKFSTEFQKSAEILPAEIPVVFHVVYSQADEKIGREQIDLQLEALNRDFKGETACIRDDAQALAFQSKRAGDTQISFCLAADATGGQVKQGIVYHASSKAEWNAPDEVKRTESGGVSSWNSSKYLNVWVCKLANGVNGYAQMPGGNPATDGIVIDYRYFGVANYNDSPYDQGKTLTHLVGNYLNLFPLWGSGARCSDDYVDDTPIHNAPNYGNPGPGHTSICPGYPLEMTLNFMDNTVDAARCMFTYGQMLRMHSVLAAGAARSGLRQGYTQCNSDVEASENVLISVYPNPSSEKITVKISSPDEELAIIAIYSSDGRIIAARELPVGPVEAETAWNVQDWPEGTYAIHIRMGTELFSELLHIVKN